MTAPFSGGCACKSIRYVCNRAPLATLNCHCRDCQLASGYSVRSHNNGYLRIGAGNEEGLVSAIFARDENFVAVAHHQIRCLRLPCIAPVENGDSIAVFGQLPGEVYCDRGLASAAAGEVAD